MNKQTTPCDESAAARGGDDSGFTLVEILVAIVMVGVLSAVAVVGVSSLTSSGSAAACETSLDSAKAATVVYFASNANTYPVDFNELTGTDPETGLVTGTDPTLVLPSEALISEDGLAAATATWTLTMTAEEQAKPTFSC